MGNQARNVRAWVAVVVGGILAGGLALAVLPNAVGQGYPPAPDPKTKQLLEFSASTIASADNVSKQFPEHGEVVLTTQAEALSLEGDADSVVGNTDQPVYMVQVTGEFVLNNLSTPKGVEPPTGSAFYFLYSPASNSATDFGLTSARDLSKLGQVTEIDLTPPAEATRPS